ncbi:hypothetical protein OF83DRAFT_1035202, partial [Amylostereum chailletii]
IFQAVKSVFDKNVEILGKTGGNTDHTRKIMTQIVNQLTVKLDTGSPMASAYFLGYSDHYTSDQFVFLPWRQYVREVLNEGLDYEEEREQDSTDMNVDLPQDYVKLKSVKGRLVGLSVTDDYVYRPSKLENMVLYDWIRLCKKVCIPRKERSDQLGDDDDIDEDTEDTEEDGKKKVLHKVKRLNFLRAHPQASTHWVEVRNESKFRIPVFTGGSLPRRDKGNFEYYCTTM